MQTVFVTSKAKYPCRKENILVRAENPDCRFEVHTLTKLGVRQKSMGYPGLGHPQVLASSDTQAL